MGRLGSRWYTELRIQDTTGERLHPCEIQNKGQKKQSLVRENPRKQLFLYIALLSSCCPQAPLLPCPSLFMEFLLSDTVLLHLLLFTYCNVWRSVSFCDCLTVCCPSEIYSSMGCELSPCSRGCSTQPGTSYTAGAQELCKWAHFRMALEMRVCILTLGSCACLLCYEAEQPVSSVTKSTFS